ncbi:MAG: FAD-binding protein [Lachnospiraceae bacterium]|jgi:fumarate reductase flavoprotein subunit|nr:FAD-binding protein [Lachnospiraceae bacterium]
MKKLSRRDFLKGTAAGAISVAAMGLAGCSSADPTTGAAETTGSETTAAGTTAVPTTEAATQAPTEAATAPAAPSTESNTGMPGFFTDPYNYKEADAVQVVTSEVVVVGAGNAGCSAACSCVENGNETVVLEAQNVIHGQGGGIGLCNTKFVDQLVAEGKLPHNTDVTVHQNIWIQRCGSRVNEALVSMWFNNGPEAGNWLIDKCAEYGIEPASFRAYAPNATIPESYDYHMFRNTGNHVFDDKCGYFQATNVLYEDSRNADKYEKPATYFFNTSAKELLVENGKVTGVFAERDGQLWLFRATKGVILATGGMHEDAEMTAYYCDDYVNRVQRCEHGPVGYSTGDGHKMGLWAGARMQDGPFPLMLHPQANAMFHGCFPFLNQEGYRFMNEGTWVQGKSMNIMQQTGNIAWSVFDANYGKYNRQSLENGVGGGMFWDTMGAGIGQEFTDDDLTATVEGDIANGNCFKADTIEELAGMIGVPADVMKASIDHYNELVTSGVDQDFHKPKDFLYPVVEAPFYAAKIGIALLAIVGGLSVNTDLQVLDQSKKPIEGLYATGNCSGDLYAIDYPINMAGNSNGRCLIWGYLLGKTMAGVTASGDTLTSRDELAQLSADQSGVVASDAVYKDGSYTGTGRGRSGEIEITVTITDGKISDIVVDKHSEDNIGASNMDRLISNAIAANSAEFDAASGATMTSDGFREAVKEALSKAS